MRPLVVIPTYNESENIERMLQRIRECLPDAGVLVVDDGSPDGTAQLVKRGAAEHDGVYILERAAKSGLGSAYRAGFAWGLERGYDAFVEIDADFSHDPAALPRRPPGLSERARRPSAHQVTRASASTTMNEDIFDCPASRSTKLIGTSTIRAPCCLDRYVISIWNPYPSARIRSMSNRRKMSAE